MIKWEDVKFELEANDNRGQYAAVFRRQLDGDDDKKIDFEEIEVYSTDLKELLGTVSVEWRGVPMENDQPVLIRSPFLNLICHWKQYEQAAQARSDDDEEQATTRETLASLLGLIRTSPILRSYFRWRDIRQRSETIRFEFLWTLFGHGTKVIARSYMDELQMFEVHECTDPGYDKQFWVCCSAYDWDGTNFSIYTYNFCIKHFSGEKPISSLDIYPVAYHSTTKGKVSYDQLQESLRSRGEKYVKLCTQEPSMLQCEHKGYAPRASYDEDEAEVASIEMTGKQSRVIVDNLSFMKSARNTMKCSDTPPLGMKLAYVERGCVCEICKESVFQKWKPESTQDLSFQGIARDFSSEPERLQFLPPRVLGYALKEKVWGQFLVHKLKALEAIMDKDENDPFWTELELETDAKRHLMAYVQHHRASNSNKAALEVSQECKKNNNNTFDIIERKGQGLVILLHGPPGVGKTLTAETIALATGRPLLTISVAEIGVDYQLAEKNLTEVFVDAARWEAVLLMDEAEVFVEQRSYQDMQQNALVSVMLRCLEYFQGIVIMTTKRVKSIDVAIQSRVQLAIRYHNLDPTQRLKIYTNRLTSIPIDEFEDRDGLLKSLKTSSLIKLRPSEDPPNGRQIRNIVTYAWALARSEGKKVSIEHLQSVAITTLDFTDSMKDLTRRQREKSEVEG